MQRSPPNHSPPPLPKAECTYTVRSQKAVFIKFDEKRDLPLFEQSYLSARTTQVLAVALAGVVYACASVLIVLALVTAHQMILSTSGLS